MWRNTHEYQTSPCFDFQIVNKGMQPADKLSLLQSLRLDGLIAALLEQQAALPAADRDAEFDTALAQLVAAAGHELCSALDGATADAVRAAALNLLESYLPLMLPFFAVQYDMDDDPAGNISGALALELIPFATEFLALLRKEKKRDAAVVERLRVFLFKMLQGIF